MNTKKNEFVLPEPIPGFDCVQWKREVHAQFRRETEGMTDEEVREYYRKGSERLQRERTEYRTKHGLD